MNRLRTMEGRWWLFGDSEQPHFGVLTFRPETELCLEVKIAEPLASENILKDSTLSPSIPSVIHGRDEHDRPISLFGCYCGNRSQSSGLRTYRIDAMRAILGDFIVSWKEAKFCHVRVHFTLLHQWMQISHPFWRQEAGSKEIPSVNILFADSPDIATTLDNGAVVSIVAEGGTESEGGKYSFTSGHIVSVKLPEPLDVERLFNEYIGPLRQLLTLFIGHPVFVEDVTFPQDASPLAMPIELLQGNHGVEEATRYAHAPFVPFDKILNNLPGILKKWFEYHARLDSTLGLYFATVFNQELYINHRFLFLAQALETYHNNNQAFTTAILSNADFRQKRDRILKAVLQSDQSWLEEKLQHANQKTLANRLDDILNRFSTDVSTFIKDRAHFANKVRHTRNFYTHFDKDLERKGKIAKGNELVLLTKQMQTLLQICVLRDLGIGDDAVSRIVKHFTDMKMVSIEE